jgi:hypothetical protein
MAQVKTQQEMFPLVKGWLESGLTQKQFSVTHQMPVHILAYWVGRYRKTQPGKATVDKARAITDKATKKQATPESTQGFIRLASPASSPVLTPNSSQLPTGNMEVELPTGTIIRFSTTIPASYLTELLKVCSH